MSIENLKTDYELKSISLQEKYAKKVFDFLLNEYLKRNYIDSEVSEILKDFLKEHNKCTDIYRKNMDMLKNQDTKAPTL